MATNESTVSQKAGWQLLTTPPEHLRLTQNAMTDKTFVIVDPDGSPIGWDFAKCQLLNDGTETLFETEARAEQVLRKIVAVKKYRIEVSEIDEVDDE